MKIFILSTIVLLTISCATSSQTINSKIKIEDKKNETLTEIPEHNVQISLLQHIPYCGGAYPSDEQLNNYVPYNEMLVLIDITNGTKKDINAENGILYLNLSEGKYAIKEKYKDVPFHEFYSSNNNSNGSYIIQGDNECYKKWWASNLLEFDVIENDTIKTFNCTVSARCFTGINPCDYYNGPYPP